MKPLKAEEEFEDDLGWQGLFQGKNQQHIGVMNGPVCKHKGPRSSGADFDRRDNPNQNGFC